jgi:EAL domain-containing protein (putative c-di-GMP-specific phosphodiesterase class I)/GGDEF domain-containing protein
MIPKINDTALSALHKKIKILQESNRILQEKVDNFICNDPTTGLRNRYTLMEDIEKSAIPTLFLIDINDYIRYIDIYGAEIANEMIGMFSKLLETFNTDRGYQLYHIEIDVFAMLHPSTYIDTDKYENDLLELMETVHHNSLYLPSIDDTLFIDITIGISSEKNNLLNHTYDALNYAKKDKKRYVYYHPFHDQTQEHRKILHVKKEIQQNLEANNFLPLYQPIVTSDGTIIKYEALLRMRQGDALISPEYFLSIAAKTNQYEQISQSSLIQAIETFKNRSDTLSLNFAQADMSNKALLRDIEKRLQRYDMSHRTVFEIVEGDAIEDYKFTRNFVERFRSLGVSIAIDDFGTGYANFSHLMELEPDYLKIDGSLVKHIQEDQKSFIMVKSITQFAQDLGVKTIAEFVATKEIFDILVTLGVDEFQGYYFGKPQLLQND